MSDSPPHWRLFEAAGVEVELMLVRRDDLSVLPAVDELLRAEAGTLVSDVERGPIAWSNELVLHVLELKTNGPSTDLEALPAQLQGDLRRAGEHAAALGGRLLGTAMHPLMDPFTETRLWPHESSPIYDAYDRIFDCRGHGWSNLQSCHLNLPFADDDEFGRLHAAVRLLLPLLPALAASSPIVEGRVTGRRDNRLEYYRHNSRRVPSLTGEVVPEPVYSRAAYENEIFARLYRDIAPHDPDGILRDEFLNSRGAIARFSRGSLEIRVTDVQEQVAADVAIVAASVAVLRLLAEERLAPTGRQMAVPSAPLAALFRRTLRDAEETTIEDADYLSLLGFPRRRGTAGELWHHLLERAQGAGLLAARWSGELGLILDQGTLASRILHATGARPRPDELVEVYRQLADCLDAGRSFHP